MKSKPNMTPKDKSVKDFLDSLYYYYIQQGIINPINYRRTLKVRLSLLFRALDECGHTVGLNPIRPSILRKKYEYEVYHNYEVVAKLPSKNKAIRYCIDLLKIHAYDTFRAINDRQDFTHKRSKHKNKNADRS